MLPELHALKVLFYAESVSVVTSDYVTKMAVTPFDPQLPKTLYANFTALSSTEPELLPIEFFCIVVIGNFAYFCEK